MVFHLPSLTLVFIFLEGFDQMCSHIKLCVGFCSRQVTNIEECTSKIILYLLSRLVNLPDPVTAGVEYRVICQVTGSDPPPTIAWQLGPSGSSGGPPSPLKPSSPPSLSHSGNLSTSVLMFSPAVSDHGKVLTCSADNAVFPPESVSAELVVHHLPVVEVAVEGAEDPARLVEGQAVTLRCRVAARPPVYRWGHL